MDARQQHVLALLRAGAPRDAAKQARLLIASGQADGTSHRLLGLAEFAAGDPGAALPHLQRACALEPGSAQLQCETGRAHASTGALAPAIACFAAATRLEPALVDGWFFLGVTLVRLKRGAAALAPLRRAHALAPSDTQVLTALARAEFDDGRPADALPLLQSLQARGVADTDLVLKLGETCSRLGHLDDAIGHYRAALAAAPTAAELWMALAETLEDAGDAAGAADAYERALALKPGWGFPLAGLLGLQRGNASATLLEAARDAMASTLLVDEERALVGYQLGKALDARREHSAAMAAWHDANAARRRMAGPLDRQQLERRVEATRAAFPRERFPALRTIGSPDARPVFVVGMPRSGTTLTEQIIDTHPLAHGAGELVAIGEIAQQFQRAPLEEWPGAVARLDAGWAADAAARWLDAATRTAPPGVVRLVDKAPLNFLNLGLAALAFPNARVVWCRRDPRDIALSIYSENFALASQFATDFDDIACYIRAQDALMRHWQDALPLPILELSYEALVSDPEPQARRLLGFLDLHWDPSCLDFHTNRRGVQTPSRWQVRQPISTRSVGRWRPYAAHIPPSISAMASPEGRQSHEQ